MFNQDFYPTPPHVVDFMLRGVEVQDKIILEPSSGKGNIIDHLKANGAKEVLCCENDINLATISGQKANLIARDFLKVTSSDISHINMIVMNPPFTADEKHILHAYEIAPNGCDIFALCNAQTVENPFSSKRKELSSLIDLYGSFQNLKDVFSEAERKTGVEIGFIQLRKPADNYETEFSGFFMSEEEEPQGNGIMSYNFIRDMVNRYVESIKLWDKQDVMVGKMNEMAGSFLSVKMAIGHYNHDSKPVDRESFKKELQKSMWRSIIDKMNMRKLETRGLRDEINKFIETQTQVPFTMRNIYHMIDMILQTTGQRMDKAILEAFDSITKHYHENRFNVEGWKTNGHYLVNRKFIYPHLVEGESYGFKYDYVNPTYSTNFEIIDDLCKALCYISGKDYNKIVSLYNFYRYNHVAKDENGNVFLSDSTFSSLERTINSYSMRGKLPKKYSIENRYFEWGKWYDWEFFRVRAYKKGTIHFEFLDKELWEQFNRKVAEIKGFPLYEKNPSEPKKKPQKPKQKPSSKPKQEAKVIGSYQLFS